MLHDIGKIIFRAGIIDSKSHGISGKEFIEKYTQDKNILDCIRFHHKQDIKGAKIASDSVAYLVSIANSISSGHDMSYIEGENKSKERFEKKLPLES
ncbi:MAG: HD domain-containing protein, partial [Eubacteriales bacterium]